MKIGKGDGVVRKVKGGDLRRLGGMFGWAEYSGGEGRVCRMNDSGRGRLP